MRIVSVPAGTIVVEVREDPDSWLVLAWAAARAAERRRDLTLVHALAVEQRFGTDPLLLREVVGALADAGSELLAAARREVRRLAPTVLTREVLRLVDADTALAALRDAAAEVVDRTLVPGTAAVRH
jgi:hypothetical protein